MKCFIGLLAIILFQDIPLKSKEEFEIKLDYQFKQRPAADFNTVRLGESAKDFQRNASSSVLPYLILNLTPLFLPEEKMRIRIATNLPDKIVTKKVNVHAVTALDLGFTDDIKDRVAAHEYTLTFITSQKEEVNKIVIRIDEDGSFYVNDEKRGKF